MTKLIKSYIKPLVIILMVGLMVSINGYAAPKVQAQDPATEIFQLVNNFRVSLGLPPFRWNGQLAAASQTQANWMIANPSSYVHTWPNGNSKEDRARAAGYNGRVVENIVGGWDMSPQRALSWWQNSPVHYNTITSSRYVEAGTAYAGSGRQGRYVIVVGLPGGQAAQSAAAIPNEPDPEPIIVAPVIIAEPDETGQILHTVGQGHALWTLAAYYEVKVSDLLLYNNLAEDAFVSVGDKIIIQPGRDWLPPPTPTPPYSVIVKNGQSLWSIAAIHNIDLADILLFNGLQPDSFINTGDEIKIRLQPGEQPPTPTATATPVQRYTVRQGDAAWSISARFGISLDELLAWNGLSQDPLLAVGQELLVVAPAAEQAAIAADQELALGEKTPEPQTPQPAVTVQPPTVASIQVEAVETNVAEAKISETATPPAEIALISSSDNGSADNPDNVEIIQIEDRPDTVLNLPLILGMLALIFLGFGGWLFIQSRRIE